MYYVLLIVIAVVISVAAAALEISAPLTFALIFIIIFSSLMWVRLYPLLWTKNVARTERYAKKNLKDPMIHLYFSLANQLDDEVEVAMEKILRKYKSKDKQALFQTIYALYKKDHVTAEEKVHLIQPLPYRQYYLVAIALKKDDLDTAGNLLEEIKIPWMKDALLCELEQKRGNESAATELAHAVLEKTRGIQKYQFAKEYERAGLM